MGTGSLIDWLRDLDLGGRTYDLLHPDPLFPPNPPPTYRIVYVDPLAIDLDGDGIETVGIDGGSTVLFDHDGDRLKTGTGWLAGDDAWLVRDLNGNGQIGYSGRT